jgi:CYTH domain-containing protein
MGIEIERKFLVEGDAWRVGASPSRIVQGFLSRDPERIVRVRLRDDEAFLTIKGKGSGLARVEVEVAIPAEEARQLLPLCLPPLIEKTRHLVTWAGHLWEIDEFYGDNAGLVVAEVELATEDEIFERPPWLGQEVSEDFRYSNAALSERPWRDWRSDE